MAGVLNAIAILLFFGGLLMAAIMFMIGRTEYLKYGLVGARYLAVDDFGRLVVADQDAHRILLIDPVTGDLVGTLGDGIPGMGPYKFDDPEGAAVRGSTYYFADSDNNRVVRYVVVMN